MSTWIIEPRDPLIARDGRPFNATPGARATSVQFPFPSTTTGAVRTQAGLDAHGVFDVRRAEEVKRIAVRGPLLAELDDAHTIKRWLFQAPADAVLLALEPPYAGRAICRPMVPLLLPSETYTNLPNHLAPIGPIRSDLRKPTKGPHFWYWEQFRQWLVKPTEGEFEPAELGHDGPEPEQRTHIRIGHKTMTAEEGALFQTRGLEFTHPSRKRLGLAVFTDAELQPGLTPFGGERRLASWRQSHNSPPECPEAVRDAIMHCGACRIVLLTPASFARGDCPDWLLQPRDGVSATLVATAVRRAQVISGWDLEKKHPKPTRRLAPAGTVLFLSLKGKPPSIARWVDGLWMQCISDTEQDRRDGFGLAMLGAWSGDLKKMEWNL